MSKINIDQELSELITRFRQLKKAISEEGKLSPAQRAAAAVADQLLGPNKNQLIKKAKELVEQKQAQALANKLQTAGVLGGKRPPPQPTSADQQAWLRNNGYATEEMVKAQEAGWGNSINSWLSEATKPINSRFSSPEEERAYWDSIKVADVPDRGGGY